MGDDGSTFAERNVRRGAPVSSDDDIDLDPATATTTSNTSFGEGVVGGGDEVDGGEPFLNNNSSSKSKQWWQIGAHLHAHLLLFTIVRPNYPPAVPPPTHTTKRHHQFNQSIKLKRLGTKTTSSSSSMIRRHRRSIIRWLLQSSSMTMTMMPLLFIFAALLCLHGHGVAAAAAAAAATSGGRPLVGGQFHTSGIDEVAVQSLLDLSRDLEDLQQAMDSSTATGSLEEQMRIYLYGRQRPQQGNNNNNSTGSLAFLSQNLTAAMTDDPIFNLYRYYHLQQQQQRQQQQQQQQQDDLENQRNVSIISNASISNVSSTGDDSYPVEQYAHAHVMAAFAKRNNNSSNSDDGGGGDDDDELEDDGSIPPHTILTHVVWMGVVHELTNVWWQCSIEYDATTSLTALDRAVALWVGHDHDHDHNDHHKHNHHEQQVVVDDNDEVLKNRTATTSLYQLAQEANARFRRRGDDDDDDDANDVDSNESKSNWVNVELLETWSRIQTQISSGEYCTRQSLSTTSLRNGVYRAINLMTVPLVQNWIHLTETTTAATTTTTTTTSDVVEVYSSALAPQLLACDPNLVNSTTTSALPWTRAQLEASYSCLRLTCNDVGVYDGNSFSIGSSMPCQDDATAGPPPIMAGYRATTLAMAREASQIDRDIFQLRVFLDLESYQAARDWYQHGYNSFASLRSLALGEALPTLPPGSQYETFQSYYISFGFADIGILRALNFAAEFENATSLEINAVVLGLVQYQVLYLAAVSSLQFSIEQCKYNWTDDAIKYWDYGAAYFVGSMEGSDARGTSHGQMLFGIAQSLCTSFGTCRSEEEDTIAAVNQMLISALNIGKDNVSNSNCTEGKMLLEESIIPSMQILLIQGTLLSAALLYDERDSSPVERERNKGMAHAASRSILPLIHEARPSSATIIDRLLRFEISDSVELADSLSQILNALRMALPETKVRCTDVGLLLESGEDICPISPNGGDLGSTRQPSQAPVSADTPNNIDASQISFGRFNFTNPDNAYRVSTVALDVKKMTEAGSTEMAEIIYIRGSDSESQNPQSTPLASYGNNAVDADADPMSNIYKFALYYKQEAAKPEGNDFSFGTNFVMQALSRGQGQLSFASEAAVVLNVWMAIVQQLNKAVRSCRGGTDLVSAYIDTAVGLWIGQEQREGSSDGWMMYAIAQIAALRFDYSGGEAPINTKLFESFNELQVMAEQCFENPDESSPVLGRMIDAILRSLSVPLVQHLLVAIAADDSERVRLYNVAVVSQCVACNAMAYDQLTAALNESFTMENVDEIFIDNLAVFLQCIDVTCNDLQYGDAASPLLKTLVSDICQSLDSRSRENVFDGIYLPKLAKEQSRMDQDVQRMYIFMRTGAYGAALDCYEIGHCGYARAATGFHVSRPFLRELATLPDRVQLDQISLYTSFFGSTKYADDIVRQSIQMSGIFQDASIEELAILVARTLQTMVSHLTVHWQLESAVDHCDEGNMTAAEHYWMSGLAYYVGSTEGFLRTEVPTGSFSLYSLATEQSSRFGGTPTNKYMLSLYDRGRALLEVGDCQETHALVHSTILPLQIVPIVQGMLYGSINVQNETSAESRDARYTSGYIFAQTILPLVDQPNTKSTRTLSRIFHSPFYTITSDEETELVFEAIRTALPDTGVDCGLIGYSIDFKNALVCGSAQGATNLPSSVRPFASIGVDVAEMKSALLVGEWSLAEEIYRDGKNSLVDETGLISLQSLSVNATSRMLGDALFNTYLYDRNGKRSGSEGRLYADEFVLKSFREKDSILPAEAAVVLNSWMYVAHLLSEATESCTPLDFDATNSIYSLDLALVYWIGDAEIGSAGGGPTGNLMYDIAEELKTHFSLETFVGANERYLALAADAKDFVLQSGTSCSSTTYIRLRKLVHEMIRQMKVPLVQGLIHFLNIDDKSRVGLYSNAVIPLLVTCDPRDYDYLRSTLIDGDYNIVEKEAIFDHLYRSFDCIGLSCQEIGTHYADNTTNNLSGVRCKEALQAIQHSGFAPGEDFDKYSRLDFDLSEIAILAEMGAFEAASDIFMYGKHTNTSLAYLALSPDLDQVPHFAAHARYFDSNVYGYDLVLGALEDSIIPETSPPLSALQRQTLALRLSQTLVLTHGALEAIFVALASCNNNLQSLQKQSTVDIGLKSLLWDKAAALLLGSISRGDGSERALDSIDWYTPFDLAQQECVKFETCTSGKLAPINERMVELLYSGRGASVMESCDGIRKIGEEMQALLLVPVIQAILSGSFALSQGMVTSDHDIDILIAELYALSEVLMPRLVDNHSEAAETLKQSFALDGDIRNGIVNMEVVFVALAGVLNDLDIDCDLIGRLDSMDACDVSTIPASSKNDNDGLSTMEIVLCVLAGVLILSLIIIALVVCRRRHLLKRSKRSESRQQTRRRRMQPNDPSSGNEDIEHTQRELLDLSSESPSEDVGSPVRDDLVNTGDEEKRYPKNLIGSSVSESKRTPPSNVVMDNQSVRSESHSSVSELSTISKELAMKSYSPKTYKKRSMSTEALRRTSLIDSFGDDIPFLEDESGESSSMSRGQERDESKSRDDREGDVMFDDGDDKDDMSEISKAVAEALNKITEACDPTTVPNPSGTNYKKKVSVTFSLPEREYESSDRDGINNDDDDDEEEEEGEED